MAFKHGVQAARVLGGIIPVAEIPTAIMGIVGTAPKGAVESMILVKNTTDAAQFGSEVPGFTIPQALSDHFAEGGGAAIVINVFNPATHTTPVVSENVVLTAGAGKTAFPPISNIVVKNSTGVTTYIRDQDYSIDDYGKITSLNYVTIAPGVSLQVSYSKQNLTAITATDIIGTIDNVTSVRKGMKQFENCLNLLQMEPKILIAPGFSSLSAVATEMRYWANRMFSTALIDAPKGTTLKTAIESRGALGTINFNFSDQNAVLLFPELLGYDPATDALQARPYSQFLSGLIARVHNDAAMGKHFSPSNKLFLKAKAPAVPISGSMFYSGTDAEVLNAIGIMTVISQGSSGLATWGNNNSAFPARTDAETFISVDAVVKSILRSIQFASSAFVDMPITKRNIDTIRATANTEIRNQIGKDALIDGECIFDGADNPITNLAQGQIAFTLSYLPPPPAQSILWKSFVNISMFSTITDNI